MEDKLNIFIESILSRSKKNNENLFNLLEEKIKEEYNHEVSNLAEMRLRENKKVRGDIFEHFAKRYLKHIYFYRNKKGEKIIGLKEVYLLKELPEKLIKKLNMEKVDVGIDLVGVDDDSRYYAIQVKFRTPNKYKEKTGIGWKQLSTFYGLVNKTGPWYKHMVFTNGDYVRHIGEKSPKDYSICRKKLENLTHMNFLSMSEIRGRSINEVNGKDEVDTDTSDSSSSEEEEEEEEIPKKKNIRKVPVNQKKSIKKNNSKDNSKIKELSLEELRNRRLAYFDKKEEN